MENNYPLKPKTSHLVIAVDGNEANVQARVGTGQYAYNILWQWAKLTTHQFDIYLRQPPVQDMPQATKNWHYHVVGPNFAWTRLALPFALGQSRKHDVFWNPAHYLPPLTFSKSVVTIHDLAYEYFPELFLQKDLYQLKNWTKSSVDQASCIIAVSQATKNDLVKLYHAPEAKIKVVYNGYDSDKFNTTIKLDSKHLDPYNLSPKNYLLFVNTIQPRKNVATLVKAFEIMKAQGYTGKLVIAGKIGWMADASLAAIHNSSANKDIVMTGYVDDETRQVLYRYAQVTVLPSLYEGFGISLVESMASGTPVAGSNNSSIPEVIGQAGKLFDAHDPSSMATAITKVCTASAAYSKKGLVQASQFSWAKCAVETLKVLINVQ